MGRAGGGGHSGSGGFSGGHRSGGSVSGGHHLGGSGGGRRAGSGSLGGFRPGGYSGGGFGGGRRSPVPGPRGPMGGGFHTGGPSFGGGPMMPPPSPRPPRGGRRTGCGTGCLTVVICMILVIFLFGIAGNSLSAGSYAGQISSKETVSSTVVRTKLTDSHSYRSDNIQDELGWFESVSKTESRLKDFYEETGIQPYVYLKSYDSSLMTDEQKEAWAKNYFDTTLGDSDGFLFIYFAEENQDEDVGYMAYVAGSRAQSVMDSQAVEIFWGYIDRYWPTDKSTDDVICLSFTDTAKAIMHVSTTKADITKYILAAVIVIGGGIVIFLIIKERNRRAHEKAKETETILNTPLSQAAEEVERQRNTTESKENSSVDDLIDHYNKGNN